MNNLFLTELEYILQNYDHILIELYNISDAENIKDGLLNPNVGTAREMDLVAFLNYFMKPKSIQYYFSNKYQYDVAINSEYYSIKHQTGNSNSNIKFKWGLNMAEKYLNKYVKFEYHLIIVSINRENTKYKPTKYKEEKTIKIYIIFMNDLNKIYRKLIRRDIPRFTLDNRGISFSTYFTKEIKQLSTIYTIQSELLKNIDKNDLALNFRSATIHNLIQHKDTYHKLSKSAFKLD